MDADDPLTSISVHASTMRLLQHYKAGSKTYEEVILRFIELYPPRSFLEEMARRAKERIVSAEVVYRQAGI
jgi:hypothetical protein